MAAGRTIAQRMDAKSDEDPEGACALLFLSVLRHATTTSLLEHLKPKIYRSQTQDSSKVTKNGVQPLAASDLRLTRT